MRTRSDRPLAMKKFLKIAGVIVLLLVVAAAGAGLYVYRAAHRAPAFYEAEPLAGDDRLRAIESVERKVLNLQGDLDGAYARLLRGDKKADVPAATPSSAPDAAPVRVSFTGPELDTYFTKWLKDSGFEGRLTSHLTGPRVGVQDGHVILAGEMKEVGAVVSLHFLPTLDADGAAHLRLDGTYVGRLAVPSGYFDEFRKKSLGALREGEPTLRQQAEINADGQADDAAVQLTMRRQILTLFEGDEVSPLVIFPPVAGHGRVPARVTLLQVDGDALTLGVELMDKVARRELLRSLNSPVSAAE